MKIINLSVIIFDGTDGVPEIKALLRAYQHRHLVEKEISFGDKNHSGNTFAFEVVDAGREEPIGEWLQKQTTVIYQTAVQKIRAILEDIPFKNLNLEEQDLTVRGLGIENNKVERIFINDDESIEIETDDWSDILAVDGCDLSTDEVIAVLVAMDKQLQKTFYKERDKE